MMEKRSLFANENNKKLYCYYYWINGLALAPRRFHIRPELSLVIGMLAIRERQCTNVTTSWAGILPVQISRNFDPCSNPRMAPYRQSSRKWQGKTTCVKGVSEPPLSAHIRTLWDFKRYVLRSLTPLDLAPSTGSITNSLQHFPGHYIIENTLMRML